MNNAALRSIPSIDKVLRSAPVAELAAAYGLPLVTHAARAVVSRCREGMTAGGEVPALDLIAADVASLVRGIADPSLKPVINATGVVLHTNLGRAPLGRKVLEDVAPIVLGYSNLEFDLSTGSRGQRERHCTELITFLTGAEDAVVVNNNAAGIILLLGTLARGKEVVISRGELIEIGGSFRIPEIMEAGGATMVEVGATNKTRVSDYERVINPNTALIFKAHKSNYSIRGFTEEASVKELAELGRTHNIPMVYDIGSGLLRKPKGLPLDSEPDVQSSLADGADLVMFSCDKLLGGPQAGVIAGRRELVRRLAKAPLMRAVRVGKLTIAALASACRSFLSDERLIADNPAFAMLSTDTGRTRARAERLGRLMQNAGLSCHVEESTGQCGGGTLPDVVIRTFAVVLDLAGKRGKSPTAEERLHKRLMALDRPIVGVLREGRLLFDALTLFDDDIDYVAATVAAAATAEGSP